MSMFIFSVARVLLLILSLAGYIFYFSEALLPEFSLAFVFAGISVIMVFGGLLNVLPECAVLLMAGGLLCFFYDLRHRRIRKSFFTPGILFFLFVALCLTFLLFGNVFTHFDNFSHYAIVLKEMLKENRFPNSSDANIMFQSYPLGTASYLFFIVKICGIRAEWVQMLAQSVLSLAMAISLFPLCKGKNKLLAGALVLSFLCADTPLSDLLVDTLLPLVALSCFSFLVYYADELDGKTICLIPWFAFLPSIKNSGIFFSLMLLMILFFFLIQRKLSLRNWVICLTSVFLPVWLWKKHVAYAFPSGEITKHAMSLQNYSKVFFSKSSLDISSVVHTFLSKEFSLRNPALLLLALSCVLAALCFILRLREDGRWPRRVLLFGVLAYLLYELGLLGMYLFSMPGQEALNLAGYDRYHKTVLIFWGGAVFIAGMLLAAPISSGKCRRCSAFFLGCAILVGVVFSVSPNYGYYARPGGTGSLRYAYDELIAERAIPEGRSYWIISAPGDRNYAEFLTRYLLYPSAYVISTPEDLAEQSGGEACEYIIVLTRSDAVDDYLSEHLPPHRAVFALS